MIPVVCLSCEIIEDLALIHRVVLAYDVISELPTMSHMEILLVKYMSDYCHNLAFSKPDVLSLERGCWFL